MQAYEISKAEGQPSQFACDLAEVRAIVRTIVRDMRHEARIYLVDFHADKRAFVQALNGRRPPGTIRRAWRPGRRGGALTEIPVDDD